MRIIIGAEMMQVYIPFEENPLIEIRDIYSFYHSQFATGYVFRGERHPFWEMVYVNNGQVDIGADDEVIMLSAGDVVFHRPDEFHSIWANYAHAPDLIVISFYSESPSMKMFEKKHFHVTSRQNVLLQEMLAQAEKIFSSPLDANEKKINNDFPGGAYMLRLLLTMLLMDMLPLLSSENSAHSEPGNHPDAASAQAIDKIISYMKRNLQGNLRFDDVCRKAGMSGTAVKQLFRTYVGISVMAYYEQVRMGEARRLLRESRGDIASVAYALGFSSPAYFSTRFRNVNGVSPREYLKDVLYTNVKK